jgi:pimeloyl-ACP methyl ester carboxylesterase
MVASSSALEGFEHRTSDRLPYSPTGYSYWEWKTHHGPVPPARIEASGDDILGAASTMMTSHRINYVELGDPSRPALLLVHGFGASSYHWRHNIPILAREYHVYALDLLGFGWSDKPIMDYDASVWRDQVVDFVRGVILNANDDTMDDEKKVLIAGNSLGGFTAMYASSDVRIKDRVGGCILLNAAGRFRDPTTTIGMEDRPGGDEDYSIAKYITSAIQRFVIACSFVYTKRPSRIEQILRQVYPVDDANVDDELVASIYAPALDESAAEVFYRVIAKNGSGPRVYVDDILRELHCPVLLAWGESDPWIKSAAADRMEVLHADFHGTKVGNENGGGRWIRRVSIDAGHCPHDEAPGAVNDAIMGFAGEVLGIR